MAFTASASDCPARVRWVGGQTEAVEFSPDPDRLEQLPEMVRFFLAAGRSVRYHTRYFAHELGHADPALAELALEAHLRTLRAMVGLGEPVVTVHTGLDPHLPMHEPTLVENLARLVDQARTLGIVVCLENLRRGPSSEPTNVLRWAGLAGAMITLDLGHALGSDAALSGRCPAERFVELFGERLFEVHVYGREDEQGHHPIEDIAPFRPLIANLLRTSCRWWTIELQYCADALSTQALLMEELATFPSPDPARHQTSLSQANGLGPRDGTDDPISSQCRFPQPCPEPCPTSAC